MNYHGKNYIDHIDSNPSNNQKSNLRILNMKGNNQNRTKSKNKTSKYVGVSYIKNDKKWQSSITLDGITKYLGSFNTEYEAAVARNKKTLELNKLDNHFKIELPESELL